MLNIINLLKKHKIVRVFRKRGGTIFPHIRGIPLSKEWYNIMYTFSKNPIRIFPAVHDFVFKLIKIHFNMHNKNIQSESKSRQQIKAIRSSTSKIWVSSPEIKHLNEKAIITVYIYNRLYSQYKKQLDFLEFTWGPVIESNTNEMQIGNSHYRNLTTPIVITRKSRVLRRINPVYLNTSKKTHNKSHNFYIKMIKWLKLDKFLEMEQYKLAIRELIDEEKVKLFDGLNLLKIERYNYLINQFKKELTYLKLKQKILFTEFKFSEIYLVPLINLLQTIYKKKVELNIVVLKTYYASSSILSQIVTAKVMNVKNRGNASGPVAHAITNNFIPSLSRNKLQRTGIMSAGMRNVLLSQYTEHSNGDSLNKFLLINKKSNLWSSRYIDAFALKNIKNKGVAGLFIKLSGRLTKRYKAQRAIKLLKYRGTLKNVYSAHKGYSSVLSRGYANINVEKTMINSKLRIGTFGLTGWVASY